MTILPLLEMIADVYESEFDISDIANTDYIWPDHKICCPTEIV